MRAAGFVCRSCYGPPPKGTKPWQAFVCKLCYVVDPNSKRGKALARAKKEEKRRLKHGEYRD